MITFIKRWLEKRKQRQPNYDFVEKIEASCDAYRQLAGPNSQGAFLDMLNKRRCEDKMLYHSKSQAFYSFDEWEEYNSPLQQAIRSRGGYL